MIRKFSPVLFLLVAASALGAEDTEVLWDMEPEVTISMQGTTTDVISLKVEGVGSTWLDGDPFWDSQTLTFGYMDPYAVSGMGTNGWIYQTGANVAYYVGDLEVSVFITGGSASADIKMYSDNGTLGMAYYGYPGSADWEAETAIMAMPISGPGTTLFTVPSGSSDWIQIALRVDTTTGSDMFQENVFFTATPL
jgi:hypothetical protein